MNQSLKGKVAVVTGASKGIGAGIAKELAAAGAHVVVNYAASKEGADKVVDHITAAGGKAVAVQGNVSLAADVQKIFTTAKEAFGTVDIVVNNAGVYQFNPIEKASEDEFHNQFNINVLGPVLTTQEALKHFPETGGSIINISSVVGTNPIAGGSLYSSTKGALDTLSKALAKELAGRKIRVNTVSPGGTETEGLHSAGIPGSDMEQWMISSTPMGRLGQPKDIADVVTFLASDAAAWLTGENIRASGGLN